MKQINFLKKMTVFMAVIFMFSNIVAHGAYSSVVVSLDYRNMRIKDSNNEYITKPVANFLAKRVSNSQVIDGIDSYTGDDCSEAFPTLVCYVGDKVEFEDHSYDKNVGGVISEWDWQYYGSMGESSKLYNRDIVNGFSIDCKTPGETTFYLCVKSNIKVKRGCCDPWSDNGNHQTIGKNKWYPNGMYWYFTAVRVVVKPACEATVHIRYINAQTNTAFYEDEISAGMISGDEQTDEMNIHIIDWDGYLFDSWIVQLPDGTPQYSGTERDVGVILLGWSPEKYLNVDFYPYNNTSVDIRYWDTSQCKIIDSAVVSGEIVLKEQETTIPITLTPPSGYKINDWNVQYDDGRIQYTGIENPLDIILSGYVPHKYLNVECSQTSDSSDGGTVEIPPISTAPSDEHDYVPDVVVKPSGDCDGIIEWTETQSHRVFDGYNSRGNKTYKNCNHTFTYRAVLDANAVINPETFKSGYGFTAEVSCILSTALVSNIGGCTSWGNDRSATSRVANPTKATVYIPWDMTNSIGTQSKTINMDSNGTLKFILPKSNVSSIEERRIYTPVELPGTAEEPVSHEFEIYVNGGGVKNIEFCKKLVCSITINGDMYEDDFTGSD